ncbi:hypothetical protein HDU96_010422 [Phlyctochytrium bullatum]|nr:hypothetical protein HDU96_010422 [Phlyctochytrium bullatum]
MASKKLKTAAPPRAPAAPTPRTKSSLFRTFFVTLPTLLLATVLLLLTPVAYHQFRLLFITPLPEFSGTDIAAGEGTPATRFIASEGVQEIHWEGLNGWPCFGWKKTVTLETAGPESADVKEEQPWIFVLIHGYPESALLSWSRVAPLLVEKAKSSLDADSAAAGTRLRREITLLLPDMRGFNGSVGAGADVVGDGEYQPLKAAADIKILVENEFKARGKSIGEKNGRVCIVGHDWGTAPAWHLALTYPQMAACFVILDGPHPLAYLDYALEAPWEVAWHSWYILWYNTFGRFGVAEWLAERNDWEWMLKFAHGTGAPSTLSKAEIEEYKSVWKRRGVNTSMLAWYRNLPLLILRLSNLYPAPQPSHNGTSNVLHPDIPFVTLWGSDDVYVPPSLAHRVEKNYAPGSDVHIVEGGSHWLAHEVPGLVAEKVIGVAAKGRW